MNEAIVFFLISLVLFIAGMYLAAPLIGINVGGFSTSSIVNNITVTTITRNKETYTITVPKNIRSSEYTGVEKLEVVNAYATWEKNGWTVVVKIKNTGTKPSKIDNIFINNKSYRSYNNVEILTPEILEKLIEKGETVTIKIKLHHPPFTSGQTISIVIHTTSGGQYPATITLP